MFNDIGCTSIKSNPYEPNQNGLAEKTNRTLVDLARTMLIDSNLKKSLWAEAVNFATQILNMTTINKVAGKSAYELVYNQKPYFGKLYPFGTTCVFLDQDPGRKKFDPKGLEGVFVGYPEETFGYRVLWKGTRKVVCTSNVSFLSPSPLAGKDVNLGNREVSDHNDHHDIFIDNPVVDSRPTQSDDNPLNGVTIPESDPSVPPRDSTDSADDAVGAQPLQKIVIGARLRH